jgi:excinuclease ABC subunit A
MQFLADVRTTCPECQGRRYRKEVLAIKVRSLSIAEVLDLTVREAFRFFRAQAAIEKKLKTLLDVGLEYLRLGQAVETLSGSECQRLKLAAHLASSRKTGCLLLLLEPTAGLHPADVVNLLDCFERLLVAGHSLVVVENDVEVIQSAEWVIDLGPAGGDLGGRLVAAGTPEAIANCAESVTGRFIRGS